MTPRKSDATMLDLEEHARELTRAGYIVLLDDRVEYLAELGRNEWIRVLLGRIANAEAARKADARRAARRCS